ncbi:MAG: cobalamin biosynthesis protein [Desulfobacterales bacterium]|jgi:cobalt-precorrin 5A hydrolase
MVPPVEEKIAIWVITPNGTKLAETLIRSLARADLYISKKIIETPDNHLSFQSLSETLNHQFDQYDGHIFIMSTGIVVRVIAPHIKNKVVDPAVVVVDDQANYAISLLSGHLGGANALTLKIADIIGADPVITTATDVNRVPAIDVLAKEKNLLIENPQAIKTVNMALLQRKQIFAHDPFGFLGTSLPLIEPCTYGATSKHLKKNAREKEFDNGPGIYVDDVIVGLPPEVLVLRPASLVAGIGCNRNTPMEEIKELLEEVMEAHHLASSSLTSLASIDVKSDETGMLNLSENLNLPLVFHNRQELNQVKEIQNPSIVVEKHVGVKSVCEASAILTARGGTLIVPKQSTKNVTVAIARINFSSSE